MLTQLEKWMIILNVISGLLALVYGLGLFDAGKKQTLSEEQREKHENTKINFLILGYLMLFIALIQWIL